MPGRSARTSSPPSSRARRSSARPSGRIEVTPRAAGVPRARSSGEHRPVPLPVEPVGARRVRGRHPVLLVRLVERMAADPRLPAAVGAAHERILDAGAVVAGEDGARVGLREAGGIVGLQHVDPPVLAARRGATRVQAPASGLGADERGPLHRHRAEARLVEGGDGGEPLAVLGPRDDRGGAALRPDAFAKRARRSTNVPSASSAALDEPAQCPAPGPGAGTATAAGAPPGSGNSVTRGLLAPRAFTDALQPFAKLRRDDETADDRVGGGGDVRARPHDDRRRRVAPRERGSGCRPRRSLRTRAWRACGRARR